MSVIKAKNILETSIEKDPSGNLLISSTKIKLRGSEEIEFLLRFKKEIDTVSTFKNPAIPEILHFLQDEEHINIKTKSLKIFQLWIM